jgi:hypothetical protein
MFEASFRPSGDFAVFVTGAGTVRDVGISFFEEVAAVGDLDCMAAGGGGLGG